MAKQTINDTDFPSVGLKKISDNFTELYTDKAEKKKVPSAVQTLAAGTIILANAEVVRISSAAPVTSTAAPTIADGSDGQVLYIINAGANNITLSDQGTLANSNLRLTGATLVLTPLDNIGLIFLSSVGDWVQVTPLTSPV